MTHRWTLLTWGICACLTTGFALAQDSEPVTAEALFAEYEALRDLRVDDTQVLAAVGQSYENEDLEVRFEGGTLWRIVNGEGEVAGVVYLGGDAGAAGSLTMAPPDPIEQHGMRNFLKEAPCEEGVTGAWILSTDGSLDDLLVDEGWTDGAEGAGPALTLHDKRWSFHDEQDWDHWGPALAMEVLDDRHGAGFQGGYTLADFRSAPGAWKTYWRDLRGALYDGEQVSFFLHQRDGETPHKIRVFASYPSADGPAVVDIPRTFDVASVDLEVTIPKAPGGEQNLAQMDVVAQVEIEAIADGLQGFPLELVGGWRQTQGDDFFSDLDVRSVKDAEGGAVAAVHDRDRLFMVLPEPLARGERTTLTIEYGGDLIRPSMAGSVNTQYSAFHGFPWYPMARRTDRHTFAATIHTPRYITGVTSGELESLDKGTDRWTTRFVETGPVLWAPLALGEYVVVADAFETVDIRVFCEKSDKVYAKETIERIQVALEFYKQVLGKYPFDAFNVVDVSSYDGPSVGGRVDYASSSGAWLTGIHGDVSIITLAYAVAYQFYGQRLVPATYRERWINFGCANMAGWLFVGRVVPEAEYDTIVKQWHEHALVHRINPPQGHVVKWGRDYPLSSRGRGHPVMYMMLVQTGGEAYADILRVLLNTAPDGILTRDHFEQIAGRYLGRMTDPFFEFWVDGLDFPTGSVETAVVEQDDGLFRVEGTLTFEDGSPPNYIPLELTFGPKDVRLQAIAPKGPETPFAIGDLPSKPKKIRLDPDHIILMRGRKETKAKAE